MDVLPGWIIAQLVTVSQALPDRRDLGAGSAHQSSWRLLEVDRRYVAMLVLLTLILLGLSIGFVLLVPL